MARKLLHRTHNESRVGWRIFERSTRRLWCPTRHSARPFDSGVPQGTVLGPLFFLCHINDLPASVKSQIRLFTDDCLLYRGIETFSDHTALQNDLKQLEKWTKDRGMTFNTNKGLRDDLQHKQMLHTQYKKQN